MTKEELEKEAYEESEKLKECQTKPSNEYDKGFNNGEVRGYKDGYRDGAEPREKRIAELKDEINTWKEANSVNSYKAFRLQEENKLLFKHVQELKAQFGKIQCLNEEIIKALNECLDYEWLHAHNGKAKYLYLQAVIDIVNDKFKEIKEK